MTINEIAKLAGVSRATVSRYLNNGYVSEEKRAAIAKIIEETGYIPSAQASALRTGKTNYCGVIIPKINSESVSRVVTGITEVMNDENYKVLLANTNNHYEQEVQFLHAFSSRQIDGVILIATVISEDHLHAISELDVPVVVIGQEVEGLSCVYYDDYHATYDLTQGLYGTCSHPAHLGVTELDIAVGQLRYQAFVDAMEAEGIPQSDLIVERGAFSIESGFEMAEKVLEDHPEVDAMVCATDAIASGALAAVLDANRRVPEDVQITGIGDSVIARVCRPSITTAHYYYRSSGREAAKMLVDAMKYNREVPREIRMGYRIVLRDSTINE